MSATARPECVVRLRDRWRRRGGCAKPSAVSLSDHERVQAALQALPVFPLPATVLLPHALLPLHVFEPRYRAMVADALHGGRVIAVAVLLPGWEAGYAGAPPVHPVVGVGVVAREERLPDGRYNILLRGAGRARIAEELPLAAGGYRRVRAEFLRDTMTDPARLEGKLSTLRQSVLALAASAAQRPQVASALSELAAAAKDPAAAADLVAGSLVSDPALLSRLLSELDVGARLDLVSRAVAEAIFASTTASGPPAGLKN